MTKNFKKHKKMTQMRGENNKSCPITAQGFHHGKID